MLILFLIFSIFLKSDCFIFVGNSNRQTTFFLSRLFEREDYIRQDIEKKNDMVIKSIEEIAEVSNITDSKNTTIRSGRSLDQDGKTNIWSIEPKMIIDESKDNDLFKLFGIFGSAILVTFQFFLLTNPIFPDPGDY